MANWPPITDYPALFAETVQGDLRCQFALQEGPPPVRQIREVRMVPFIGDQYVLMRLQNGHWDIPGAWLHPTERPLEALNRSLREDIGGRLLWFDPLGAWRCEPLAPLPEPPPEPVYHFVGYGEVEIVLAPELSWVDDQVAVMECLTVERACRRFQTVGRPDLADLYRLAARLMDARDDRDQAWR